MGVGSISFVGLNGCTTRMSSKPRIASACSCVKIICNQRIEIRMIFAVDELGLPIVVFDQF